MKCVARCKVLAVLSTVVLFAAASLYAAPHNGEAVTLYQPDGSPVTVHIFGDELYAVAECPDGFTLVQDAAGWVYYADLSADGSTLVSTGVRYTGLGRSQAPNVRRNLRTSEERSLERRSERRRNIGDGEEESMRGLRGKFGERRGGAGNHFTPAPMDDEFQPHPGDTTRVVGLVLFISFPDFPAPNDGGAFLRHADSAYNRPNFRGSGSVYDYFNSVSEGHVQYTNYISAWVQAPNTFAYYDGADNYGRVQELIRECLRLLNNNTAVASAIGSRVTTYTRNWGGTIGNQRTAIALNIHPIRSGQRWSHGIWSHRGWFRDGAVTVGGIRFYDYQFTGLGNSGTITANSSVNLSVVIHENGHMLFDWPDLYPYVSGQRNFVQRYCIMSSNNTPPQMPNPYFRSSLFTRASASVGNNWDIVTDVTNRNGLHTHIANSNTSFRYVRNTTEWYMIEARTGGGIPGNGVIIWHIHTQGDNANYDVNHANPRRRIPLVAVVPADNGTGTPSANATFNATRNQFHRDSRPAARWHTFAGTANNAAASPWTGDFAGINVTQISNITNNQATFMLGTGGAVTTFALTVQNGTGGGTYASGATVTITATVPAGMAFDRWTTTSAGVTFANATNATTTFRMPNNAVTVTATFRCPTATPDANGYFFHHTFETPATTTQGWGGRIGPETAANVATQAANGSRSVFVSGRTEAWHGVAYPLDACTFVPGSQYSFSGNVMYNEGAATSMFKLTLQYVLNGETVYAGIDSVVANRGRWVMLENPRFSIPAGATDLILYVEMPDNATSSFYIDDMMGGVRDAQAPGRITTSTANARNNARSTSPLITVRSKMLTVGASPETNVQVRIVDLSGKTVATINTRGGTTHSLSNIPTGIYIVEANKAGSGVTARQRVTVKK